MKKQIIALMITILALAFAACASSTSKSSNNLSGVPTFVNEAYKNASEDVLVGVGAYRIGNDMSRIGSGKGIAETRARADISRQLNSVMKNMIEDFTAQSEADPKAMVSFQQEVTRALSQATLRGSRVIAMDTHDGMLWVAMEYSKSLASKDFDAAQASARLAIPAAINFNAQAYMDAMFKKEAAGGPVPVTE